MKRTAVLFDGGFFYDRIKFFVRKYYKGQLNLSADLLSEVVHSVTMRHVGDTTPKSPPRELYRTYYYDCPPFMNGKRYPLPEPGNKTPGTKHFGHDPDYKLRGEFHDKLRAMRKVALRMGVLTDGAGWQLHDHALKDLLKGRRQWDSITNADFSYKFGQKAVDLKLGMDITTMALGGLVDVIVLVAGDSDFVPAAKLARSNGIDFILDPMWSDTTAGLREHVDNVRSFDVVNALTKASSTQPVVRPSWWTR